MCSHHICSYVLHQCIVYQMCPFWPKKTTSKKGFHATRQSNLRCAMCSHHICSYVLHHCLPNEPFFGPIKPPVKMDFTPTHQSEWWYLWSHLPPNVPFLASCFWYPYGEGKANTFTQLVCKHVASVSVLAHFHLCCLCCVMDFGSQVVEEIADFMTFMSPAKSISE